jgi:hypothetical protein
MTHFIVVDLSASQTSRGSNYPNNNKMLSVYFQFNTPASSSFFLGAMDATGGAGYLHIRLMKRGRILFIGSSYEDLQLCTYPGDI